MKEITNKTLLEGILNQDDSILSYLYSNVFPSVELHILKNKGSRSDARDIFHDAIIVLYRKLKSNHFDIHTDVKGYIFGICRNLWLKELELKQQRASDLETDENLDLVSDSQEETDDTELDQLFQHYFSRIDEDCQRVLRLYYDNVSLKEIAEIMGYRNMKYAKKKKFKCKERLIRMIRNDPRFRSMS